eukprot:485148_1
MEGKIEDTRDASDDENEFTTILREWKLSQYADILEEEGWEDPDSWSELDENMLMEMGFKTGHRKKFLKFIRQKYGLDQSKNNKNQKKEQKDEKHDEIEAIDTTTKLPLKIKMDERLFAICNENKSESAAVISINIDNMKDLKNKGSHIGDTVIQFIGFILKKQTKADGIEAYRYYIGGDQFGLLVIGRNKKEVLVIAENIKKSINDSTEAEISMGVAMRHNDKTYDTWFQRVENALKGGKKITFGDGNVYEGEWKNNMKHGQGKCVYKNGDVYVGSWKNDKKDGNGKLVYHNGRIVEGEWKNDAANGFVKTIHTNGEVFEGQVINGSANGQGKYFYKQSGNVYDGTLKNDKINGYGDICKRRILRGAKMTYGKGGYYQGQWVNEKAQGQGQCLFPNGDFYEGEWKNNKRDGYGTYKYSNGTLKKGQWRNDTLVQEY